jgi:uncharacterized protein YaiI (UPF0178 family)
MCLARKAVPLSQDGFLFDKDNIGAMLAARYTADKIRRAGKIRIKGPKKRIREQDDAFARSLKKLITRD